MVRHRACKIFKTIRQLRDGDVSCIYVHFVSMRTMHVMHNDTNTTSVYCSNKSEDIGGHTAPQAFLFVFNSFQLQFNKEEFQLFNYLVSYWRSRHLREDGRLLDRTAVACNRLMTLKLLQNAKVILQYWIWPKRFTHYNTVFGGFCEFRILLENGKKRKKKRNQF